MKDLVTGVDQQVKFVVVKVSDSKGHISLLRKNAQHLYLIEVRYEDIEDVPTTEEESVTVSQAKLIQTTNLTEETRRGEALKCKTQVT